MSERVPLASVVKPLTKLLAFKKHSGLTFCNEFLQAVSMTQGNLDFNGKLINDIYQIMKKQPWTYRKLEGVDAQYEANNQRLVYAIWSDPRPEVTDHGCIVIPGDVQWSKQFKCDVPLVANVGKSNFYGRAAGFAFRKTMKPEYYLWLGS